MHRQLDHIYSSSEVLCPRAANMQFREQSAGILKAGGETSSRGKGEDPRLTLSHKWCSQMQNGRDSSRKLD